MNSLMMAIQAIALLCGPRVATTMNTPIDGDSKVCQRKMLSCVQAKADAQPNKDWEKFLASCVQEVK